jgi:hypothetical protein
MNKSLNPACTKSDKSTTRGVFDGDKFPCNEDYLLNTTYSFSSLDDVESFLKELGYDLANIKWGADFEFL